MGWAVESFAADHDFGALAGADVPAGRGVVAPDVLFAVGAGRDDDHDGWQFAVAGTDGAPEVFQDLDDAADGWVVVLRDDEQGVRADGPGGVVDGAAGRVGQDLVGHGDGLEPVGGARVAGVAVGVMLAGQFAVSPLDLRRGGIG